MKNFLKKFFFLFLLVIILSPFTFSLNATLNYPLNNTILTPHQNNILLNVTLEITEGSNGSVYFINISNNEIICSNNSILNQSSVLCLVSLNQGETLIWQVNLSDDSTNITIGDWNFSIAINNPPIITHLSYFPLNPNITRSITFNISAKDDFNETFIIEYFIYNQTYFLQNDLLFSGNITLQNNTFTYLTNLTTIYLKKGEIFNLTIRAFDSIYSNYNSIILEIQDSKPEFFSEINSTEFYTINRFRNDSTLIGYCFINDVDNDNYTITAKWYKNNELYEIINPYYISAGLDFTCSGNYCWGSNDFGQLGDNTTESKNYPTLINSSYNFKQLSLGLKHSCGIIENGSVYCWGLNNYGQLGIGNFENSTKPILINNSNKFLKISLGYYHSCGIIENGSVYCWGSNNYGQLGIGFQTLNITNKTSPFPINSTFMFKDISSGSYFSCGLLINGSVYCWGLGIYGNLGNGNELNYSTPYPVNLSSKFIQVSAGYDHTCGLLINGSLYCWGNNDNGELGLGITQNQSNPKPLNYNFKFISTGKNFTCALLFNNSVYCWGSNNYGQLGNGSLTDSYSPVPVNLTELPFMHFISIGVYHVCGILVNKTPVCWGKGTEGQLGNNLNLNSENPVFVNLIPNFFENQNINNLSNNIYFGNTYKLECSYYNQTNFIYSLNSSEREISLPNLEINFYYPENNTLVNMSYAIPIIFILNETSKCKFSIDNGNFYYLNNAQYRTNFTGNFSIFSNAQHNLSVNCTEYYGTSKLFKSNITINDHTPPTITIIKKDAETTSINVTFSTNEPSNWTFLLINKTTMYFPSFANRSSARFTDLEQDITYYFNITACDQLKNCGSVLDSVKTSKITNQSSSSSSSTTTSTTETNTTTKFTQQWNNPTIGQYLMNIPTSNIAITNILFDIVNNITGTLIISIEKISLPNTISELENSYQYLKIEKNTNNLSNIKIKFRVENSWINNNNINSETISLYRYNQEWEKQLTTKTNKDTNYNYYEAITPTFSYFAIKGELNENITETSPSTTNQDNTQQTTQNEESPKIEDEQQETETSQENTKITKTNKTTTNLNLSFLIIPLILLILIAPFVGFIIYQRNQSLLMDKDLSELTKYVQKCKSQSIENSAIKSTLLKVGWPEYIIDLALYEIHIPSKNIEKIKDYIKEMRKTKKDDEIKENLKKVGWTDEAINEAFK